MLTNNRFQIIEPEENWVCIESAQNNVRITLLPSDKPISCVRVKWFFDTAFMRKVLADTWGVALADLQWRELPLPHPAQWYFLAFDGRHTHGFGVKNKSCCIRF